MDSSRKSLEIVWFDPRVNNSENTRYQDKYLKGKYNFYCFQNRSSTISKLDQLLASNRQVLIISCGSQGEGLCKAVQNRKFEGIIIFTMNIQNHQKWISQYRPMVIKVFEMGFDSLKGLSIVKEGFNSTISLKSYKLKQYGNNDYFNINEETHLKDFLKNVNDQKKMQQFNQDFRPLIDKNKPLYQIIQSKSNFLMLCYYRQALAQLDFKKGYTIIQNQKNTAEIKFSAQIKTSFETKSKPSHIFEQCVKRSMDENSLCSAQVFLKLFELCESKEEKVKLQKEVVDKCDLSTPKNILATFCLMYTGNVIYGKLNKKMADFELPFSIELIACLRNQIAALTTQEKKQVTLSPTQNQIFRGIKQKTTLDTGNEAFWPAFSSTSLNSEIAKSFAKTGEFYDINLDKGNPHPHLKITGSSPLKSQFAVEEQILLFPNFKFKVSQRSGNRLIIQQK